MSGFVWLLLGPWGSWDAVSLAGVAWFMGAGAIAPLVTQFLFYAAMTRVGVARAASLRNTTPLFASVLAVIFLGEQWTVALAIGTIMIIAAGLVIGLLIAENYKSLEMTHRTIFWFALSGVATGVGISLYLLALNLGQVVFVDPLISTSPLFTLLLARLFLRRHETITAKVVAGAAAIFVGVIVILGVKSWSV
jgi:uncharacterized membrane protein